MNATSRRLPAPQPTTMIVTLVSAGAALNVVSSVVAGALGLPVYLDTIGTLVVSVVLGPWWGALTGVLTNLVGALYYGPTNIPFALANVTAALLWGYGVRSLGLGRRAWTYFLLCAAVGIATGAVGAVVALFVFGGSTGHASDAITAVFVAVGGELARAVFGSSVLTSMADKIISGFVGLAIIRALPPDLTEGLALPGDVGMRSLLIATVGTVIGVAIVVAYVLVLAPPAAT